LHIPAIAPGFIDRVHARLEILRDIVAMKTLAPAFCAAMILVSLDQLCFDGRYIDPVIGTLRYLLGAAGLQF
jgi:hypothetical protein